MYILIITLILGSYSESTAVIQVAEFNNAMACDLAGVSWMKSAFKDGDKYNRARFICTPKGKL